MSISGINKRQDLSRGADDHPKASLTNSAVCTLGRKNISQQTQGTKRTIKASAEWTTTQKMLFTAMRWLVALVALFAFICICIFAPHFAAFTVLIFVVLAFSVAPDLIKLKIAYGAKRGTAGAPELDDKMKKAHEIKANHLTHSLFKQIVSEPSLAQACETVATHYKKSADCSHRSASIALKETLDVYSNAHSNGHAINEYFTNNARLALGQLFETDVNHPDTQKLITQLMEMSQKILKDNEFWIFFDESKEKPSESLPPSKESHLEAVLTSLPQEPQKKHPPLKSRMQEEHWRELFYNRLNMQTHLDLLEGAEAR